MKPVVQALSNYIILFNVILGARKRKIWSYKELEALSPDAIDILLAEIPSDAESVDTDSDSENLVEDDKSIYIASTSVPNKIQILSNVIIKPSGSNLVSEKFVPELLNSNVPNTEEHNIFDDPLSKIEGNIPNNDNCDYDSEDELPLAEIAKLKKKLRKQGPIPWRKVATPIVKIPFIEPHGASIPEIVEYPHEVFLALFTEEIVENIVFQTNLYATQKGKPFKPTFKEELLQFLAINILMGVKPLPSYKDYWSSRDILRDTYISSKMSRNRFSWLLGHIHLNDNALLPSRTSPNFDKLYKLRPFLDLIGNSFQNSYKPGEYQSVDESMIRFKGRSSLKQYMPQKPIKRGYKVWVRADVNGYICEFQIYTGKVDNLKTETGLGERVVKDLSKSLAGKYYKIFFDNYFTSVSLMTSLLKDSIYASGTVRINRKFLPTDICEDKQLSRGENDWRQTPDGLLFTKWKDQKGIHFLSNYHNPNEITSVNRRQRDGSMNVVPCPSVVKDYNKFMGGVDKADMLKSLYEISRKSKKWWHRIFFHFVDVTVTNAYIIFRERSPNTKGLTLKQFRLSVVEGLVTSNIETPKKGPKHSVNNFKKHIPPEVRYVRVGHLPVRSTSRRCGLCSNSSSVHRTKWYCKTCNVGLCLNEKKNCFEIFHLSQ